MSEAIAFDTHRFVKNLTDHGFTEEQAEVLANEQVNLLNSNLATKTDIALIQRDIKVLQQAHQDRHRSPAAGHQDRHRSPAAGTKTDIEVLQQATKTDIALIQRDIEVLRKETKADIEALRQATKTDIALIHRILKSCEKKPRPISQTSRPTC